MRWSWIFALIATRNVARAQDFAAGAGLVVGVGGYGDYYHGGGVTGGGETSLTNHVSAFASTRFMYLGRDTDECYVNSAEWLDAQVGARVFLRRHSDEVVRPFVSAQGGASLARQGFPTSCMRQPTSWHLGYVIETDLGADFTIDDTMAIRVSLGATWSGSAKYEVEMGSMFTGAVAVIRRW